MAIGMQLSVLCAEDFRASTEEARGVSGDGVRAAPADERLQACALAEGEWILRT
jgi:hypothetical protein